MRLQEGGQGGAVRRRPRADEHERAAVTEGGEDGGVPEVGRDRGHHPEREGLHLGAEPVAYEAHVVAQVRVGDAHALGCPGRSGCVDDVYEVVRRRLHVWGLG